MKKIILTFSFITLTLLNIIAQTTNDTIVNSDPRAQLNTFLSHGSVSVNLGYINYNFTNSHLNSDYQAEKVKIPHLAARVLLGYQFNKYLSIHYSVMRAALWPRYYFINDLGDPENHGVGVNEWGLTLKTYIPISNKFKFSYEGGIGLISRDGFITGNERARVTDENYLTYLSAAGMQYRFHKNWDALLMYTFSPTSKAKSQPYTTFASLGFVFHMHQLSDDVVKKNSNLKYFFPKQYLQIGMCSDAAGFFANDMFSISADHIGFPIFWRGKVEVQTGGAITYQRNVFHTKRVFSLDWGTSLSFWQTNKNKDQFIAVSVFPVLRFWFLRSNLADPYFMYSVVGPTYLSKVNLDGRDTGEHVTYQDFMGFGAFFGKKRNLNAELKIIHYSNGNVFAKNPGIDVPLTLNFGYAF